MNKKHRWYEKLFFYIKKNEQGCLRLMIGILLFLILGQILLMNPFIRKYLLLTEFYEGKPAKFYKSLNAR